MKKKIWGVLLSVAVLVTTVNFPTTAGAEENKGGADASGIVVKVSDDMNGSNANESDEIQTVQISAQNQSNMDAVVRIFLLNEDKETADTEVEIPNLCDKDQITDETVQTEMAETLKSALTLESGTNSALDAQWIEKKDDSGNVTAKYLETALPAGTAAAFDMQLMYRTDEENYTKKTIVRAKAFVDEQDVTKASDVEDEDNEAEVKWEVVTKDDESEAAGEDEETAGSAAKVSRVAAKSTAENNGTDTTNSDNGIAVLSDDTGDYTAAQIKKIMGFLEEYPGYFLLDTTNLSKENANWDSTIYSYDTDFSGSASFVPQTGKIDGTSIVYWDLSGYQTDHDLVFSCDNNWDTLNGNDYYKTQTYKVSDIRGKLYVAAGEYTSTSGDDNGHTYHTLTRKVFERSSLAGRTVYFDNTNVANLTPPYIKIVDQTGDTQIVEMELCYNQEHVYSYQFPDYVLPGTSFQFTDAKGNNAVPGTAVTDIDADTPCYNGRNWVEYVPESSTVRIYVDHPFEANSGATVVFTKAGADTGTTKDIGTLNGTFVFDFADGTYDGFYVKYKDDNKVGNTTEIKNENDIREAINTFGSILTATVGDWRGDNEKRTLTFGKYSSLADTSLNIPKGTFKRDSELLYVNSTFYDYYSDEELRGNNRKNLSGDFSHVAGSSDKVQAQTFDKAIAEYFKNTTFSDIQSPLYFGEFTGASTIQGLLDRFVWNNNNGEPNRVNGAAGARQGLVNDQLVNDQLVMGDQNTIAPYFSEDFLRGNNSTNSELGYVFPDVDFPFVKNEDGYWEFNSYDSSQTLRMKQDDNGTYFLDRVGGENAVYGFTSSKITDNSNFFPFNDKTESGNPRKLNYAFGVRLDIPFYMTSDGKVQVTDGQGNTKSENIVFNFSGDDDVWVFIDGELILDIGGQHGAVDGQIDFADCVATTTTNQDSSKEFERLSATEEHTLTMFYMERGIWESNMHITFNFPQANQLEVEKEVDVPDDVNPYFESAMEILKDSVSFPIEIENLVTSGGTVDLNGTQPAENEIYDEINNETQASLNTEKNSSVCQVVDEHAGRSGGVLQYYYPGEKQASEGQSVTDGRSLYIDGEISISEHIQNYGYLQFDTYAETDSQPSSPFVALIDGAGNKIGAWASGAVYRGGDNNLGRRTWKTLRVNISKLQQITGTTFNYSNIVQIQFAYWDDITIYLDDFRFRAPAQYTASTGFAKEQNQIPDYGSYQSRELEPVNGAEYTKIGNEGTLFVQDGSIYLKDGEQATFSDQFRRESYISLTEECNTNVFDTTWEVYENGTLQKSGNGLSVDDERTESTPGNENAPYNPDPSLLFKSFDEELAESEANYFSLGVKYTNTLKLEDLTITKALSGNQTDDGTEYTFEVTFTNIAGMALEDQLSTPLKPMTFKLNVGAAHTIKGIPAGTQYVIREVPQTDQEFTLIEIKQTSGDDAHEVNLTDNRLTGTVNAEKDDAYTFVNDINPSVEISGTKSWADVPEGVTVTSVTLDLERKLSGQNDSQYEPAKDMQDNDVQPITITNDTDWHYIFSNVPKYNGTGEDKVEYVYRVVETHVNGVEVAKSPYLPTGGTADDNGNYNITNTYQKTNLEILKVDAEHTDSPLSGVEFKLEKLENDGTVDTGFIGQSQTTGTDGKVQFSQLEDGTYRLTETKARSGYSLLKSPLIVVIDRTNGCTVRSEDQEESEAVRIEVKDNTLSIKVSNRLLFELPSTGGYLRAYMIAGGLALAGIALFIYRLQKRRKGARAPRR